MTRDGFVPISPIKRVTIPSLPGFLSWVAVHRQEEMPLTEHDIRAAETFFSASQSVLVRARRSGANRIANLVGEYVDSCAD